MAGPDKNQENAEFAEVAVALPLERTFHYTIPAHLSGDVMLGKRVRIDFSGRSLIGYVLGLASQSPVKDLKEIRSVIDSNPVFDIKMLELARWVSEYYCCSIGEALQAAVPAGITEVKPGHCHLLKEVAKADPEPFPSDYPRAEDLKLNPYQEKALQEISGALTERRHEVFLLHGVTGSGKTEVYIRAIDKALKMGGTSIVLVPEISLTPQTVGRFLSRFGKQVAVHHSHLTERERREEWVRIRSGEARIVIGARSAVFSPLKDLALIVVDEEHETSYKQEDVPRYHARDVAIMRASLCRAVVALGGATPSLESYRKSEEGIYKLLTLPERVDGKLMPEVEIVDLRREIIERKGKSIVSRQLETGIKRALARQEQVILLLNRRGFSTFVNCKRCGEVIKCRRCDIVMVYHKDIKKLTCHYCNYQIEPPSVCPSCNSEYMGYHGLGTQRVESEITRVFPDARIARLDTDAARKRGAHHRILREFAKGNIDILVGTQMIAKGLDFPRVSVVGVISADTALNLPDFRAGERTFSLLTQVAGRSGRGGSKGEVVIQTYEPGHYAVAAAVHQDYEKFYRIEIVSRQELALPPFVHIANIIIRGRNEEKVISASEGLFSILTGENKDEKLTILGPAPLPIPRIKGYYRWHITIKLDCRGLCPRNDVIASLPGQAKQSQMTNFIRKVLPRVKRTGGILVAIDIDPLTIL